MFRQRTFVGLDVHARSAVGHAMDEPPARCGGSDCLRDPPGIWGWLESLPPPVKVTYEAGPTGYGLARFLRGRGVVCLVAAPSKLTRAGGESGQNRLQGRGASVPAVTSG